VDCVESPVLPPNNEPKDVNAGPQTAPPVPDPELGPKEDVDAPPVVFPVVVPLLVAAAPGVPAVVPAVLPLNLKHVFPDSTERNVYPLGHVGCSVRIQAKPSRICPEGHCPGISSIEPIFLHTPPAVGVYPDGHVIIWGSPG
jgi:hypothetical protein